MTNTKACLPAGRHKIQNKFKAQMSNDKTFCFGICYLDFGFILCFGFRALSLS